jgi:hypothetical protein
MRKESKNSREFWNSVEFRLSMFYISKLRIR